MPLICRIEPTSSTKNFTHSLALPFEQVLATEVIQQILEQERVRYRQTIYTPVVTLWAWLSQVLDADKSLSNAVSRVIASVKCCGCSCAVIRHRSRKHCPLLACLWPCCSSYWLHTAQAMHAEVRVEERALWSASQSV